jgi:hypothetical protein
MDVASGRIQTHADKNQQFDSFHGKEAFLYNY